MATIEVTDQNFNKVADGNKESGIVLLDFWAAWCGPCRQFAPIFEKMSGKYEDITFGKIDTEAQQGLAGGFEITAIPTLMAVRDGIVVFQQAGALPESMLEELIAQVRALDMEAIRDELKGVEKAES